MDEYGELPLEPVGFHGRLDGVVDPESSEGTDLDKDVEETDETTSDGGRRELGEVDGNDQGQETDGEASEETTKVEDGLMRERESRGRNKLPSRHYSQVDREPGTHDRTVGKRLRERARDKDDVGKDDGPLPPIFLSEGQLKTGSEERPGLEEGDHVGPLVSQLGLGQVLRDSKAELSLERGQGEGSTEETSVV